MDPWHIMDDGDSYDGDNEFIKGEERIVDIGVITIINENEFTMDVVGGSNENSSSNSFSSFYEYILHYLELKIWSSL
jgi:hypothetical protein